MKNYQIRINARIAGQLETVISHIQATSLAKAKAAAKQLVGSYEVARLIDVVDMRDLA